MLLNYKPSPFERPKYSYYIFSKLPKTAIVLYVALEIVGGLKMPIISVVIQETDLNNEYKKLYNLINEELGFEITIQKLFTNNNEFTFGTIQDLVEISKKHNLSALCVLPDKSLKKINKRIKIVDEIIDFESKYVLQHEKDEGFVKEWKWHFDFLKLLQNNFNDYSTKVGKIMLDSLFLNSDQKPIELGNLLEKLFLETPKCHPDYFFLEQILQIIPDISSNISSIVQENLSSSMCENTKQVQELEDLLFEIEETQPGDKKLTEILKEEKQIPTAMSLNEIDKLCQNISLDDGKGDIEEKIDEFIHQHHYERKELPHCFPKNYVIDPILSQSPNFSNENEDDEINQLFSEEINSNNNTNFNLTELKNNQNKENVNSNSEKINHDNFPDENKQKNDVVSIKTPNSHNTGASEDEVSDEFLLKLLSGSSSFTENISEAEILRLLHQSDDENTSIKSVSSSTSEFPIFNLNLNQETEFSSQGTQTPPKYSLSNELFKDKTSDSEYQIEENFNYEEKFDYSSFLAKRNKNMNYLSHLMNCTTMSVLENNVKELTQSSLVLNKNPKGNKKYKIDSSLIGKYSYGEKMQKMIRVKENLPKKSIVSYIQRKKDYANFDTIIKFTDDQKNKTKKNKPYLHEDSPILQLYKIQKDQK